MAQRLKIIDRDTPMLLPPSIQEWIDADHPARLLVEMIQQLDLSCAAVNHRGSGDRQYPPGMMLALLIYCYTNGVFSSRKIERATYDSIGARYICANEHPDHDTINTFRKENGDLLRSIFAQTLQIAASLGLVEINQLIIASDGTIFEAAGASEKQYKSRDEIDQELADITKAEEQIYSQVDDLIEAANRTERQDSNKASGSEQLRDPKQRKDAITKARREQQRLARRKAKLGAAREFQKLAKQEAAEKEEGLRNEMKTQSEVGTIPKPKAPEVDPSKDRINVHEPETSKMKLKKGGHGHGFNAQASVDTGGIGLVVGCHVTDAANDRRQLAPCISEVEDNLGEGSVYKSLADQGYDNTYQIDRLERRGINSLCELQRSAAEKKGQLSEKNRSARRQKTFERRQEHYAKITTEDNTQTRKLRKETIEPLFGTVKSAMGFREFRVKGLEGADAEWHLVLLCTNTKKLNQIPIWRDNFGRN